MEIRTILAYDEAVDIVRLSITQFYAHSILDIGRAAKDVFTSEMNRMEFEAFLLVRQR